MDGTGLFIRVVRQVEMFRRFFIDTHNGDIRGCLFFPPQLEQQTETYVFIKAMPKRKNTDDDPHDTYEET
jgi:hypothetical protein